MNTAPVVLTTAARHSSESNEHYTPSAVVEAARETLGGFDLDPASCEKANETVKATFFHTAWSNGYRRAWQGRVFLNPPGGLSDDQERPVKLKCRVTGSCGLPPGHTHTGVEANAKKWWQKLAREFSHGHVTAAIFVGFSIEILQTTQCNAPIGLPLPLDFPLAFPSRRIAYVKPDGTVGTAPPHASVLVCVSNDAEVQARFASAFGVMGRVIGGPR